MPLFVPLDTSLKCSIIKAYIRSQLELISSNHSSSSTESLIACQFPVIWEKQLFGLIPCFHFRALVSFLPLINASNAAAAASIRRLTCFVVFDVVVVIIVVIGNVFVVFVVKPSKKTKVRC